MINSEFDVTAVGGWDLSGHTILSRYTVFFDKYLDQ